jgi:hypothetical protein
MEDTMNIDRRELILPALAIGLLGVVPAFAASPEEDALAKNVEAFRATPMAGSRTSRPLSPTPPTENRSF